LLACSDLPELPIGQLRLGLASGIGEAQYRLADANFSIDGAAQLTLSSGADPDTDSLQRALPVGDYSVELLPGWRLERRSSLGTEPAAATLVSSNPMDFSIQAGELTSLTFQFRTSGEAQAPGTEGELSVDIEVDGVGAPQVLISEFMKNPELLPDAEGEWLELYNAGSAAMDLGGCELRRDEQSLPLEGAVNIAPGGYLTFSNGEAPGFEPDVLYRGVTLPNTGSFVLSLACGAQLIDQVTVDPAALPNRAGRSLSLSRAKLDRNANDLAASWCEAVDPYNGDFGTPGKANPSCAP
jgi:hypothetical protein